VWVECDADIASTVRQLLELFTTIPNTTDTQISVTKSCIEWAVSERRGFLRQNLETRLVSLYMQKQSYYEALTLINSLLKELKRLDDKLVLVEVQLLESRVYHALGNIPKGRAALTSARTSAASVYTPPLLQAGLDMQSGMLHAEDGDFNTSFSYFIEAMEGYHSQDEAQKATSAFQYMLLCKVMLNLGNDVTSLMTSKHAITRTAAWRSTRQPLPTIDRSLVATASSLAISGACTTTCWSRISSR
jgi:26S proteasome regulatory subunit N6